MELLVAMTISVVVMAAIYGTFKSQEDAFVIQDQVTAMQQNLRGARYTITRDLQMVGYYTDFDTRTYTTIDWDPTFAGLEAVRPILYGRNNDSGAGVDVKPGTDVLVIVKASNDPADSRLLTGGDAVGSNTLSLNPFDINLDAATFKFGLLVKADLTRAEIFQVQSKAGNAVTFTANLQENYGAGDQVIRADVILYKINEDALHPSLQRRNLGNDLGYQTIAENIDNLQFRYVLNTGAVVDNPAGQEPNIRAVQFFLLARTNNINRGYTNPNTYTMADQAVTPNDGYRRKLLTSLVKTRNVGL